MHGSVQKLSPEQGIIFSRNYPAKRILKIRIEPYIECTNFVINIVRNKIMPFLAGQIFNYARGDNERKIRIDIFFLTQRTLFNLAENLLSVIPVYKKVIRNFQGIFFRVFVAEDLPFKGRIRFYSLFPEGDPVLESSLMSQQVLHQEILLICSPEIGQIIS